MPPLHVARWFVRAASALLTISLMSVPATAQPPINIATETDAAALYRYGKERYAVDDIVGAFEAYHRSCTIQPTMEACARCEVPKASLT